MGGTYRRWPGGTYQGRSFAETNKRLLQIGDRGDVVPLPIHLYAVMLAHVNSSVNPIVYGLTNKQFRSV